MGSTSWNGVDVDGRLRESVAAIGGTMFGPDVIGADPPNTLETRTPSHPLNMYLSTWAGNEPWASLKP
jgi:hypothetical protein